MLMNSREAPLCSAPFRLMQWPELRQLTKDDDGRARERVGVARRKTKTRRQEGKWKGPLSLFIRRWIKGMHGNRGGRKMIMWLHGRLDFWEVH